MGPPAALTALDLLPLAEREVRLGRVRKRFMPGVVLIAALIPVSDAIQTTGGSDLVAGLLRTVFGGMPGILAVGGVMLASMAVTPFLYPNRRTTPGGFLLAGMQHAQNMRLARSDGT
ncbi:hypothetical protein [Brevundimonas sp.]|uniref:hypothetical protein n=1 Tax=Brevundimonas sp. TaxID=1871086 RepID=UPI0028A67F6C|nr:hypothetical protein [Brevundimonas sp.]